MPMLADVVGFSHGGAVAQQFAIGQPTRVNRLALLSTSCGVGAAPGRSSDVVRSLLARGRRTRRRWPRADPLGVLRQLAAISTWSSIPVLGGITAPTLLICGEHDRVVPRANSRLIAARIPKARLVTIQAGHDLQKPGPGAAAGKLVQLFLDPITGRRGPCSTVEIN
jgi:pimeloyl-ACP methyl ester carboxylesterase